MSVFNVKSGIFRALPEQLESGTMYAVTDEKALYIDLPDSNTGETSRIRISDFQVFDSLEDLNRNINKSEQTLYYIKSQKNAYGIEIGNVFARYDKDTDEFYKVNADTGATSVQVVRLNDRYGRPCNILTDIRYDSDKRKIIFTLGERASVQTDVDDVTGDVDKLNSSMATLLDQDKSESGDAIKSIRTIAREEIETQLIPESAQEALDTLVEIAEWIQSHPDEVIDIQKDIADIKKYIGTIPDSAQSTDIVDYISEVDSNARSSYQGSAGIASVSNNVVTLKSGVTEVDGVISNSSGSDIVLSKSAITGSADDITLANGKSVSEQLEYVETSWEQF